MLERWRAAAGMASALRMTGGNAAVASVAPVKRRNVRRCMASRRRDPDDVSTQARLTPAQRIVQLFCQTCEARLAIWHPLTPDLEARCRLGDDFWDEILGNPPIAVFTARA